jgi:SAF domain
VKAALVISERDNVATALEVLEPGRTLDLAGHHVVVQERIASGHKVALVPIASGQAVLKYGSPIGTATADIAAGAHVHTHNVASARGRGDLGRVVPHEPGVRLAEPDGEAAEAPTDVTSPGGSHE